MRCVLRWGSGYRGAMASTLDPADLAARLEHVARAAREASIDAVLVSPGPDLRYLIGYDAVPLERLTCLVIPAAGAPVLVVPELEEAAARASGAGALGIAIRVWGESADAYEIVADEVRARCGAATRVAVDDRMWAVKAIALREAIPDAEQVAAGSTLATAREIKSSAEIEALAQAAAAIDRVHGRVPGFLRAGRTEREIAADIAAAIVDEGHVRVDFVIVASGPNGASPHHEPTDRPVAAGEPIVVDIGGTMPSGYCSDETRMYCIGEAPAEFSRAYAHLLEAQAMAVAAVRPGAAVASVDAAARDRLGVGGLAEAFIHRTGHGIGLETHEEPYIRGDSERTLVPGMVFSVEPGFYLDGRFGARIEDIVACTTEGVRALTQRPRELVVVPVTEEVGP